jgi:hypothetical protein
LAIPATFGPTPLATESDQIIMDSMPIPHPRLEKKEGFLKRSGRMNKKGREITQKTLNPIICCVVVGTLAANVLGQWLNRCYADTVDVSVMNLTDMVMTYVTNLPPFQARIAHQMKSSKDR